MPTLSELLAEEFPEESGIADSWRRQLAYPDSVGAIFVFPLHPAFAARRILGVGITHMTGPTWPLGTVGPAVLLQLSAPLVVRLLPGDQLSYTGVRPPTSDELEALRQIRARIAEYLDWTGRELPIVALPAPVAQVAPGDEAHSTGGQATFGARIWTMQGTRGILTAGHAAPTPGAGVYDATLNNLVGTVDATYDCHSVNAPRMATPDVAAVELDPNLQERTGQAPVPNGPGTARVWDTVTAYGARTWGQSSALNTALATFGGPTITSGDYGEAAITMHPISTNGDSGAPVYNQAGQLVGHIVAGYANVYSVMQDVTYQLRAVQATLR